MISTLSITVSLQKTKKQSQDLHDMVTDSSVVARYSADIAVWECVDSRDLVPGDLVQIANGTLHADLLLLQGKSGLTVTTVTRLLIQVSLLSTKPC